MIHQKTFNNPRCPRCNFPARKNGHQRAWDGNLYQNHQCTNSSCRHQFKPDAPCHSKFHPHLSCPLCGRPMYIFKYLSDCLRPRCSGYRDPISKCTHKINIPLPGIEKIDTLKFPLENSPLLSKYHPFNLSRMRYSKETLSLSLYFSIRIGLPSTAVSKILSEIFCVSPSYDIINI